MSLCFGDETDPSSNLNWSRYKGDATGNGTSVIGEYIVWFAAVDGLAVYPLISLSLGDILCHAYHAHLSGEQIQQLIQGNWKRRVLFRLIASVPQAVAAIFMRDLPALASLGVIFTLLSYTICPSLLYICSGRRMEDITSQRSRRRLKETNDEHDAMAMKKEPSLFFARRHAQWLDWAALCLIVTTMVIIIAIVVSFVLDQIR